MRLPLLEARETAIKFVKSVTRPDREWTLRTIAACLPRGWILGDDTTEALFYPVTITHVAAQLRIYAIHETELSRPTQED